MKSAGKSKDPASEAEETHPSPSRRRLPGVEVRPGAVKQARREAGLSLAQVGKGRVTAPAIYLIETGKTRPSLPTLEHIAHRTGKPVEFFLADPDGAADESHLAVVELEDLVAVGRGEEALALGHRLLDLGSSAFRLGRIRYLLALAYIQLAQPAKAAPLLGEARAHFEAVDDDLMVAECLGAQAEIADSIRDGDSVSLARQALALCRGLTPVPVLVESRLLGVLATALVGRRDWDGASASYQQAIDAAGSLFDLGRIAGLYRRLSESYRAAGQPEAASRFASRSAALMEVLSARASLARSESALGLILKTRGRTEDARVHSERAQELAVSPSAQLGTSEVLLSFSELALEEGDPVQAQLLARQALELAEKRGDAVGAAESHISLGRIADKLEDSETVDREFELAIRGLEQVGVRDKLLHSHGAYAEILERRGELQKAYAHMKKAVAASRPAALQVDVGEELTSTG